MERAPPTGPRPEALAGMLHDGVLGEALRAGPRGISHLLDGAPDGFSGLIAPVSAQEFFEENWQRGPRVFPAAGSCGGSSGSRGRRPVPEQTWADCLDMLTLAWGASPMQPPDGCDFLVFKNRQMSHAYDWLGPCAALLEGASCVVNHAEFVWPPFTELCLALREQLLHVYCNSYVTPPMAQAVPPHADDRDVFVLQLLGSKSWKIYGSPPVKMPYTDEQVGKNGRTVPEELLASPPLIEVVLRPGDVLYMPRGFVHEACCPVDESSWHATLAVATHDWSWTKVVASTLAEAMDLEADARWRRAVPLGLGLGQDVDEPVEAELRDVLDLVRQRLSVPALRKRLAAKLEGHNRNQVESASSFQQELAAALDEHPGAAPTHWRTRFVREQTHVRRSLSEEEQEAEQQAWALGKGKGKGKGRSSLTIRDEVREAVMSTICELERQGASGMAVSHFSQAVPNAMDRMPYDDLTQLCFARLGVAVGALQFACC